MRKFILPMLLVISIGGFGFLITRQTITGAPPYGETEEEVPETDPFQWLSDWKRPEGPVKVALQAGHWKAAEVPDELERLRNNTGSSGGGKWEWEVNLEIANRTAELLKQKGIETEILAATIPPGYFADVFVAIHADGNLNQAVSGYKIAAPWRDWTGKAGQLAETVKTEYVKSTNLPEDPNISRNMRGYYAFAWWRYEHALHPMTPGVIIETGFLTNASDRKIIVARPDKAAEGVAAGIMNFLRQENLWTEQEEV